MRTLPKICVVPVLLIVLSVLGTYSNAAENRLDRGADPVALDVSPPVLCSSLNCETPRAVATTDSAPATVFTVPVVSYEARSVFCSPHDDGTQNDVAQADSVPTVFVARWRGRGDFALGQVPTGNEVFRAPARWRQPSSHRRP
jgi:hypothetical protein